MDRLIKELKHFVNERSWDQFPNPKNLLLKIGMEKQNRYKYV